MRQVGLTDLDLAARVLLAAPPEAWPDLASTLVEDAHVADLWRKRYATAHPNGGTGSLYAQAALYPRSRIGGCSKPYCMAMAAVLEALQAWRNRVSKRSNHEK
ncbi:hypothetical protein L0666_00980 [Octadecabacter sp. CECT 8868]|uniref:DUF7742 family protein n=1 Tax=Octadecabacter algicola TaxID=2909342 RepID=UPI001F2F4951|nr:hypothetical protein [Octadecabacter algicola]MCF2903549.1 hypothetical protein [Octadecabacter algicola]